MPSLSLSLAVAFRNRNDTILVRQPHGCASPASLPLPPAPLACLPTPCLLAIESKNTLFPQQVFLSAEESELVGAGGGGAGSVVFLEGVRETWWPGLWPPSTWTGSSRETLSLGLGSLVQKQKPNMVEAKEQNPQSESAVAHGSEIG